MAFERVNGVRFGDLHSYYDFGMWLSLRPDYGNPVPKTNTVEVPGMDGVLDMTEANSGEVKYSNRTLVFTFAKMVDLDDQEDFKAQVRAALHGKYIDQIIPDEAPDWYYSGRAEVTFTKLSSWKLRCVVTVDAAPYAMKVTETRIELADFQAGALRDVEVPSENVSGQGWNTDLRFGTKQFPQGLGPAGMGGFKILKWPPNAYTLPGWPMRYQVVDAEGHVYNSGDISHVFEYGELNIETSVLAQAGIVVPKVYRLLVQNIGGCSLHVDVASFVHSVWNERKTVVPSIIFQTNENPGGEEPEVEVNIIVNGQERTIRNTQTEYEDIVLREGMNEIIVPMSILSETTVSDLYMIFREGRL